MLKDPSASWMRAGIYYWLGFASLSLAAALARLAVLDSAADRLDTVRAASGTLAVSLMAALCFAIVLLILSALRPCRPERPLGGAVLGLASAVMVLALGVDWKEGSVEAGWMLFAALVSGVILHFFTPLRPRPFTSVGRRRRARLPLDLASACKIFIGTFVLLNYFWYVAFSGTDDTSVVMRFILSPAALIIALIVGLITGSLFLAGAGLARYARGAPTLTSWYSAGSAVFTVILLLAESSLRGEFGFILSEPAWSMLTPLILGIGAVLLPRPRLTA